MWSGAGVIGGGVSTFYFGQGGTGIAAATRGFFAALAPWIPSDVTIGVGYVGDLIDDASGDITGVWSESSLTSLTGTAGLNYVRGVGGRVLWHTEARRRNRITRGTTFLVPLNEQAYEDGGSMSETFRADAVGAANALVNAGSNQLMIWSRPDKDTTNGGSTPVTSVSVPDTPSWLTSRKH